MKYAFKLTRTKGCREITVSAIFPVDDYAVGYYHETHSTRERMMVYDTYEDALKARKNELLVVEFTKKPQEELRQMFKADMEIIKDVLPFYEGATHPTWKSIVNKDSYYSYRTGINPMDARVAARVHIIAGMLKPVKEIMDAIPKVLPGLGGGKPINKRRQKLKVS